MPTVRLDLTDSIIERLRDTVGRPVGDAVGPRGDDAPADSDYPYVVVYERRIREREQSGPFNDPQADKMQGYDVISVGQSRRQAGMLAERVRDSLTNMPRLLIPDYRIQHIAWVFGETDRSTEARPAVFAINDIVVVWTTPIEE